jgi:hypothetical protein
VSIVTFIRIENEYGNACIPSFYLIRGKIYGLAGCMQLSFPRFFVVQQVAFMPPVFPDVAQ